MADPIQAAIYDGIKRGIEVCLENNCFGSAVILIFSGIDAMARLSMPAGKDRSTRSDFIVWCDRYLGICKSGKISGEELYSSRCAMVHEYGVDSSLTRTQGVRRIGFMNHGDPDVKFDPTIDPKFVLLSIESLSQSFFAGIDDFLIQLFSNENLKVDAERRLQWLMCEFPVQE